LFPISLILTFIKQKITQEIFSLTYLKTAFEKLFQEIAEVLLINFYLKIYLQPNKENQHSFIIAQTNHMSFI